MFWSQFPHIHFLPGPSTPPPIQFYTFFLFRKKSQQREKLTNQNKNLHKLGKSMTNFKNTKLEIIMYNQKTNETKKKPKQSIIRQKKFLKYHQVHFV